MPINIRTSIKTLSQPSWPNDVQAGMPSTACSAFYIVERLVALEKRELASSTLLCERTLAQTQTNVATLPALVSTFAAQLTTLDLQTKVRKKAWMKMTRMMLLCWRQSSAKLRTCTSHKDYINY